MPSLGHNELIFIMHFVILDNILEKNAWITMNNDIWVTSETICQ